MSETKIGEWTIVDDEYNWPWADDHAGVTVESDGDGLWVEFEDGRRAARVPQGVLDKLAEFSTGRADMAPILCAQCGKPIIATHFKYHTGLPAPNHITHGKCAEAWQKRNNKLSDAEFKQCRVCLNYWADQFEQQAERHKYRSFDWFRAMRSAADQLRDAAGEVE